MDPDPSENVIRFRRDIPVYDAHVHVYADPTIARKVCVQCLDPNEPDSVLTYMDRYGIEKTVLLPNDRVQAPPQDFDYREINEKVATIQNTFPERVCGLMRLNPLFETQKVQDDMDYFLGDKGLGGLKMVARADFYRPNDLRVMGPVMEKARQYDVPLLFHSGHPSRDLPSLQARLAQEYPSVKVVLAHMGLHDYLWEAIIACKENENVFVDMSQAWPYDLKIFVDEVGADRVMYGTDSPFQSPRVEQLKVHEVVDDKEALEKILYQNAQNVWGL